jgi:hypothetical protein
MKYPRWSGPDRENTKRKPPRNCSEVEATVIVRSTGADSIKYIEVLADGTQGRVVNNCWCQIPPIKYESSGDHRTLNTLNETLSTP